MSFWLDSLTDYTLKHNKKYELDVNLSWKVDQFKTASYAIGSYSDAFPLDWMILDTPNSKLVLDILLMTETVKYTFSIDASVLGDINTFVNQFIWKFLTEKFLTVPCEKMEKVLNAKLEMMDMRYIHLIKPDRKVKLSNKWKTGWLQLKFCLEYILKQI
jgi:hypothetical protein